LKSLGHANAHATLPRGSAMAWRSGHGHMVKRYDTTSQIKTIAADARRFE